MAALAARGAIPLPTRLLSARVATNAAVAGEVAMTELDLIAIVREYVPDATDDQAGYILWNFTGYPCFWDGDPETELRRQLQDFADGKSKDAD